MAENRDRISVDIRGIRERINRLIQMPRADILREMKLAQVLRWLIMQGLTVGESMFGDPPSVAELVDQQWANALKVASDVPIERLSRIRTGDRPTDGELIDLATVLTKPNGLPYRTEELLEIRDRTFPPEHPTKKEKEPNGCR